MGSKHWVSQPTIPLAHVKLMLNADMIGRLRGGKIEVRLARDEARLRFARADLLGDVAGDADDRRVPRHELGLLLTPPRLRLRTPPRPRL